FQESGFYTIFGNSRLRIRQGAAVADGFAAQVRIYSGNHIQCKDAGKYKSPDDGYTHGNPAFRPGPKGDGNGRHSQYGRQACHEYGPEPLCSGIGNGFDDIQAGSLALVGEFNDKDTVLGDQTYEHDDPDLGKNIQ